jgi:hypothetical protein
MAMWTAQHNIDLGLITQHLDWAPARRPTPHISCVCPDRDNGVARDIQKKVIAAVFGRSG